MKKLLPLLILLLAIPAWGQTDTFYIGEYTESPDNLGGLDQGDVIGFDSAQSSAFLHLAGPNDSIRMMGAYWRSNVVNDTNNAIIAIYEYDLAGDSATDSIYAIEVTSKHDVADGYDSTTGLAVSLPTEGAYYTIMISSVSTDTIYVGFKGVISACWTLNQTPGPGFDDPFDWQSTGLTRYPERSYRIWAWGEVYGAVTTLGALGDETFGGSHTYGAQE